MKRAIYYIIFILTVFPIGCEKEYPWDLKVEDLNRVVVDGILTNELKPQVIRLSRSNPGLNQPLDPVSAAEVRVFDGTTVYVFTEDPEIPGTYYSEPFQTVIDRSYHLLTIVAGDTIEATAGIVPVTPLETFEFYHDTALNRNRYLFTGNGRPAMTDVYYDWTSDTAWCSTYGYCKAQETFYQLDNTDINEIFGPDRQVIYFPGGTQIIRKKYSLTDSHQEFIRSLLMETDWSGGIFDVQHGNVRTNLSGGALGYFAACMVVSDTVLIN